MAKIASKTEWVETEDGVRRLVVEGAPIPPGLGLEDKGGDDDVDPRTLTRPVVDEEASKSAAERAGAKPQDPNAGISTDNVESRRSGGGGRQRGAAKTGGGES